MNTPDPMSHLKTHFRSKNDQLRQFIDEHAPNQIAFDIIFEEKYTSFMFAFLLKDTDQSLNFIEAIFDKIRQQKKKYFTSTKK